MRNADLIDRLAQALAEPGPPSSDFDLNPAVRPEGRVLRPAGVLMGLVEARAGWSVLLTIRASGLKHHPGQIAFPGGKVDPEDADSVAAALREADEEVGLNPTQVRVLGTMPAHETVTGFSVTPVLGVVEGSYTPVVEAGEVDEAFLVPLAHLLNPDAYQVQSRIWLGQRRSYYAVPWGPYYIWGATARMLRALAARV